MWRFFVGKFIQVLKVAGAAVAVSIVLILLGALISYKLRLGDAQMSLFAVAIYAVGSFIAGFGTGKLKKGKRLLWGLCAGAVYFAVILLISIVSGMGLHGDAGRLARCAVICIAAACIGGVLG